MRHTILVGMLILAGGTAVADETFTLTDYLHRTWRNELVRYQVDAAKVPDSPALVGPDGKPVPVQVRKLPGGKVEVAFIVAELPADGKVTYRLKQGEPTRAPMARREGDWLVLDAGPTAVRVPAPGTKTHAPPVPLDTAVPPLAAVRGVSGKWMGKGRMAGQVGVTSRTTTLVADGPVYAEVRTDYALTAGRYSIRVRVVRGQDVVLVSDEFDTTPEAKGKAYFQFSMVENLQPERVTLIGRLWRKRQDQKKRDKFFYDYALDFADRRELAILGYVCWWPETARLIGLYGSKTTDTLSFFPRRIGQWRNPMGTYVQTRADGQLFLSLPLYVDQEWNKDGVRPDSPYYTGILEPGWPRSACRRKYAFFVSTRDQLKPASGRSSLATAFIRHSDFPLDKMKDWIFEWNSTGVTYPRLYVTREKLNDIRKRVQAEPGWDKDLGRYFNRPISYILTGDAKVGDQLLHNNDQPDNDRRATTWGALPALRFQVRRLFERWGYAEYRAPNNAMPMSDLVRLDAAMSVKTATPAERTEMRRLGAFVAQMCFDQDWHPTRAAWHLGNPNMRPRHENHLSVASVVLPKHPLAPQWRARGAAELKRLVNAMVRPSGAWRECPHYQWEAALFPMLQSAVPQKLAGGYDLFADPKFKKTCDYLVGLLTPPSPRFRSGGRRLRVLPAFGNGSWEFMPITGWIGTMTADSDPAFSKRMMWAWNEQGRPHGSKMSRLVIDPNLPAEEPVMKSTLHKGFGCTLRSGFPSELETWMAFRHGDCIEHYNYGDQGSFMLHAKGSPLVLHFGSQYTPYFKGPWYFNRACVNHRALTAEDPIAKHFGEKFGDYALGSALWRDTDLTQYVMYNKAFASFPSADYARGEQTFSAQAVIGKNHAIRLPPNTALLEVAVPKHRWVRQVLMLKDPDPRAPNYYLIRDDWISKKPLPGEWNIWTLAKKVDVTSRPAVVTGHYGVDLDVYMAEPTEPKWTTRQETNKFLAGPSRQYLYGTKTWVEVQTNLRAKQAPGKGFLAVLYPRFHDEAPPAYTTLADGKGVKVVTPRGTDYAFLSAKSVTWSGEGISFSGTAGAVRRIGNAFEVIFLAPGTATVAGRTITAEKPGRFTVTRP